jgi:hypothetical protein
MESNGLAIEFDVPTHTAAGSAGKLAGRLRRPIDQAGDLVER